MPFIEGIYAPSAADLLSVPIAAATVRFGGFVEDTRHFGLTKKSGARENQYPRGTEIFNYRQISMVEKSELQAIADTIGVEAVTPEALGANILVTGIENFTKLPPTTRLYFEGGVTIVVFGENDPCVHPGKVIEAQYGIPGLAPKFVKAAIGRRGIIGWVEKEGEIRPHTSFRIVKPR